MRTINDAYIFLSDSTESIQDKQVFNILRVALN